MRYTHWLNRGVTVLSLCGVAVTAFLTLAYLNYIPLYCDSPLFDCGKIAQHPLAHGLGIHGLSVIPTPAFGLLLFLTLGGLSIIRAVADTSHLGQLAMRLQGFLVSAALCVFALLSYAEMFIIHAWCFWCVLSALLVVSIAILLLVTRGAEGKQLPGMVHESHSGEASVIAAVELCGVLLIIALLRQLHHTPPPQIAPQLSSDNLHLADCCMLGDARASATLVELGNFSCPHCKAFLPQLQLLLKQYQGKMKIIFSPAIRKPDETFVLLAAAAEAGARQRKYQAMHEALFTQQEALGDCATVANKRDRLLHIAASLGLQTRQFMSDLADPMVRDKIQQHEAVALRYHLFPLPKFIFLTPSHPPVILQSPRQLLEWLRDPHHW